MDGLGSWFARLALLVVIAVLCCVSSATASASRLSKWSRGVRVDHASLVGLACPGRSLCVAIDSAGRLVISDKPTGTARQWTLVKPSPQLRALTGIACPSEHLCVAVDSVGDVVVSRDPRRVHSWSVSHVDSSPNYNGGPVLTGISCPTELLCVAVDYDGNAVISTDPAAGASAWRLHQIDNGTNYECYHYGGTGPACIPGLVAVSCASVASCVAIDWAGGILSTSAPVADGAWGGGEEPASESYDALACPSARACLLGQLYSDQLWTRRGDGSLKATIVHPKGAISGIWCQSTRLCFATSARYGKPLFLESRTPTAAHPSWRSVDVRHPISAVSCPTSNVCFATAADGTVLVGTLRSRQRR